MIDVKQYIESGVIEEYALGKLSEQERAEVECLSTTYPEIGKEVEEALVSLTLFAEIGATQPDPRMKEKIWDSIIVETKPENIIKLGDTNNTDNATTPKPNTFSYAVAAVLAIIAVGTTFWAFNTNSQLNEAEMEIAQLNTANKNIVSDFTTLKDIVNKNNSIYELPNAQVIKLDGIPDKSPKSMAFAVWDKETGDVYLDVKNLPKNPEGKQYQLWTISDKGLPVSVGVFDQAGQREMLNLGKAETSIMFAVTLEEAGGVESPTMTEMYIAGKVQS
jgi:anti-sigma-K factor RskA